MSLTVVSAGGQTLVEDAGRPGHASSGVGMAGGFDRAALRQANVLVGNPTGSAVLEVLGGGLRLRATREHVLAVTGAVGPIHVGGVPVEHGRAFVVEPGGWVLALEDRGHEFLVQHTDGRVGVLRDLSNIERG